MKITSCVIVKNEESNLPNWLNTMEDIADELIIVDTGSSDATLKIANKSRARVFEYNWNDDFSAAKNYALSKATGDFIIFCDADEYFISDKDKVNLRKNLEKLYKKDDNIFLCSMINIDTINNKVLGEVKLVRVFRNLPQLRYEGKVHEQLFFSGKNIEKMTVLTDVHFYHTGYSEDKIEKKLKRNLILIEEELKNNDNPRYYAGLADCYFGLGDYEKAFLFSKKFLKENLKAIGDPARIYKILIASGEIIKINRAEIMKIINDALNKFPLDEFFKIAKEKYEVVDKIQNSACVIVKNEELDLPIWIENIKDLVDEMIVVDTGSTDNTKEIAKNAGAKVYDFKWCGDFAAAKNFALSKAKGKWIFFLDADEYFPKECHKLIKEQMLRFKDSEGFVCRLINIDADNDNRYLNSFVQLRVFRNDPLIKYESKVHEKVVKKSSEKFRLQMFSKDIFIYHTGYSEKRQEKKARRNLTLLFKEIEENGETPLISGYLSDCYSLLKDKKKAYFYAKKAVDGQLKMSGMEVKYYTKVLEGMIDRKVSTDKIKIFLDDTINKYPNFEDFYILKAMYLKSIGDYDGAIRCLEGALLKINSENRAEFSCFEKPKYTLYFEIASLNLVKNDLRKSLEYYIKAIREDYHNIAAWNEFYSIIRNYSIKKRLFFLRNVLPNKDDIVKDYMKKILDNHQLDELYVYYLKYSSKSNKNNLLLASNKYDELQKSNMKNLEVIYKDIIMNVIEDFLKNGINCKGLEICKMVLPLSFQEILVNTINKL